MGTHGGPRPFQKTCFCESWSSRLVPVRCLLQYCLSTCCSFFPGISTCSSTGFSMGYRWISAPTWTLMGCRGTTYVTMVLSTECREISAPVSGALPPFSFPLWCMQIVSLTFSHSSFPEPIVQDFLPFFIYATTGALPIPLLGSLWAAAGLPWSYLKMALGDVGAASCIFPQKPPVQPPLPPKPCHINTVRCYINYAQTHTFYTLSSVFHLYFKFFNQKF